MSEVALPGMVRFRAASQEAARILAAQGLDLPDKPPGIMPGITEPITDMTETGLMVLFGRLRDWCDFYDCQLAAAEIDEASAEARAVSSNADSKNVTVTKARAELDPDLQSARAYRRLVHSQAKRAARAYDHVSRELYRRTQPRRAEKEKNYGWGQNGKGHLD